MRGNAAGVNEGYSCRCCGLEPRSSKKVGRDCG